jgi:histone-lysine N-methyltransferase SETD1
VQIINDSSGAPHVGFFSRTHIRVGQELTFDYRFKEEDFSSKVLCMCGAPTCRGYLN